MKKWISDLREATGVLSTYLKIDCFPLAVRFVNSFDDGAPSGFLRPSMMGFKMAFCQAIAIARKWGYPFALSSKDIKCGAALLSFGWGEVNSRFDRKEEIIKFVVGSGYTKDEEIARKMLEGMPFLTGESVLPQKGLLLAPLKACMIEDPDIILIYGNTAQITRLIQAMVYMKGEAIRSEAHVGLSCVTEMIKPMLSNEATYIVPGRGERQLGMAGNDEMVFALPAGELNTLIAGLRKTHKKGTKYPINQYLFFEPRFASVQEKFAKKIN